MDTYSDSNTRVGQISIDLNSEVLPVESASEALQFLRVRESQSLWWRRDQQPAISPSDLVER
jgi:hypothetical protein